MSGPALDRAIQRLETRGHHVIQRGSVWRTRCTHEGAERSDSLVIFSSESRIHFYCHSRGCTSDEVRESLGLTVAEMYHRPNGRTLATYVYEDGRQVHRLEGKSFRQSGASGTPTLYRASNLAPCTAQGWRIFLAEGEEDVHALEAVDECATCAPMGAANFTKVDAEPLRGAEVVAVVDRDEAGDKWARAVATKLAGIAASVRFVQAAVGKDSADHLAAGLSVNDFLSYEFAEIEPAPTRRPRGRRGWNANLPGRWLTDPEYLPGLSLAAWWLLSWALCWSVTQETDGFIPAKTVQRTLRGPMDNREVDDAARELVAAGLLTVTDGGFQVVDWEDSQPTSSEMASKRQEWQQRQERSRSSRRDAGRDSQRDAGSDGDEVSRRDSGVTQLQKTYRDERGQIGERSDLPTGEVLRLRAKPPPFAPASSPQTRTPRVRPHAGTAPHTLRRRGPEMSSPGPGALWSRVHPGGLPPESWPSVVVTGSPLPGFDRAQVGGVGGPAVLLPALMPGAPASLRYRWEARAISLTSDRCPLCGGVAGLTEAPALSAAWRVLPVSVTVAHSPQCGALFTDEDASYFDPRGIAAGGGGDGGT